MFLFTSLSKVHLNVEPRDGHTPALLGAISNMLASLKNATLFSNWFKVRAVKVSARFKTSASCSRR